MPDQFDKTGKKSGKRRRCYYEFSKDYPGTRYYKDKRSSTSDALDNRKKIRTAISVLIIILVFVMAYFIVYTVMEISGTEVEGLDEIGVTAKTDETVTHNTTQESTVQESTTQEDDAYRQTDSDTDYDYENQYDMMY